jgi:hypothetical protein
MPMTSVKAVRAASVLLARASARQTRRLVDQLHQLGYQVQLSPTGSG